MDKDKEKMTTTLSLYFDRIEEAEDGETDAILYYENEEGDFLNVIMPGKLLPENSIEGDYLTLTISRDEAKTAAALSESRRLLKDTKG